MPRYSPSRYINTLSNHGARSALFSSIGTTTSTHIHQSQCYLFYQHANTIGSSLRTLSTSTTNDDDKVPTNNDNQLRIAVVGGGAAGMTAALHLSPLVAAGLVQGPIDVYESTVVKKKRPKDHNASGASISGSKTNKRGGKQLYPGSGANGRDIGVGIWSTAWWPFLRSLKQAHDADKSSTDCSNAAGEEIGAASGNSLENSIQQQKARQSYTTLLQDLEACGSYVGNVGYRTPNGGWMVKSELNDNPFGIKDLLECSLDREAERAKSIDDDDPALLFVREKDLLSCLRNAVKIEKRLGTIKYHSGVRVDGIDNVMGDLGSLVLQPTVPTSSFDDDFKNTDDDASLSPQYHLIIAADGLYSPLRSRFAGHHSTHATGITVFKPTNAVEYNWTHTKGQREATEIEDREYIVFRGNAPKLASSEDDGSGSFQTWGEERSMRFAAVPFHHETEDLDDDEDDSSNDTGHYYSKSQSFISKKQDEEVWFATISDPAFLDTYKEATANVVDAEERKQMLLKAFGSWHKPVVKLIESTPAEEIMYEVAIAHRHNASPVSDVARILEFEQWQEQMKAKEEGKELNVSNNGKINGRGPILVFIGDAMMAVDPVLAQGFTIAMESGASIVQSIERILIHPDATSNNATTAVYRPELLRKELLDRHYHRERRLLQLLRSTELVQRLAQPHGLGATFATWFVRPLVKLCPDVIKKRVFDYMIRYSLGVTGREER